MSLFGAPAGGSVFAKGFIGKDNYPEILKRVEAVLTATKDKTGRSKVEYELNKLKSFEKAGIQVDDDTKTRLKKAPYNLS